MLSKCVLVHDNVVFTANTMTSPSLSLRLIQHLNTKTYTGTTEQDEDDDDDKVFSGYQPRHVI
jgi:hypothetical protein